MTKKNDFPGAIGDLESRVVTLTEHFTLHTSEPQKTTGEDERTRTIDPMHVKQVL